MHNQKWLNRVAQQGFCGWELKTPATAIDDSELLENAADDLWIKPNKIALKNRAREILDDLARLHHEGHLHSIEVDAIYFVGRLNRSVEILYPYVQESLIDRVSSDAKFKNNLFDWAFKQGIACYNDPSFYETASRQIGYCLLVRIPFYEILSRHWNSLPRLDIAGLTAEVANKRLRETLEQARQIDWHAVFEEDFLDSVALPDSAIEKLIPYPERHSLGQYLTLEWRNFSPMFQK